MSATLHHVISLFKSGPKIEACHELWCTCSKTLCDCCFATVPLMIKSSGSFDAVMSHCIFHQHQFEIMLWGQDTCYLSCLHFSREDAQSVKAEMTFLHSLMILGEVQIS